MDRLEESLKSYYTQELGSGLSKVFTPKEVRDKMTVHAESSMKILVLFNFEFCYDLWKKGCKDVTFASDDELKNRIVETTWGFKTELVEPRSINKKFEGMKFDLIITNPPYTRSLHNKILKEVFSLSKKLVFVSPVISPDLRNFLNGCIKEVEFFDGNSIFNINSQTELIIGFCERGSEKVQIRESDGSFYSLKNFSDHNLYSKFRREKLITRLKTSKLSVNDKLELHTPGAYNFAIPLFRGHVGSKDFYTIVRDRHEYHVHNSKYKYGYHFETIEESKNFYSYLKLKSIRFLLSLNKPGLSLDHNATKFIPWLDFSRSWSDEEAAAELGITNEELLWMIQQIPDYYPEDAEIYRKLEEKLMNKR